MKQEFQIGSEFEEVRRWVFNLGPGGRQGQSMRTMGVLMYLFLTNGVEFILDAFKDSNARELD